jgi:hypothetical protein
MKTRSALQSIALVGAGVGCGLWLASFRHEELAQRPERAADATVGASRPAARDPQAAPQLATAALAAMAAAASAPPKDHAPSDDPHIDEPSIDERVRSALAEPIDERWASRVSRLLEDDLAEASQHAGFRYSRLECRSTTCVVELDWPNRQVARSAAKSAFPGEFHRTQCEQRLLFPEGPVAGGRAHAFLILRCNTPAATAAMPREASNTNKSNDNRL